MKIFILFLLPSLLASTINWTSTYSSGSLNVRIRPSPTSLAIMHSHGSNLGLELREGRLMVTHLPRLGLVRLYRNGIEIPLDTAPLLAGDRIIASTPFHNLPLDDDYDTLLNALRDVDGVTLVGVIIQAA